MKYFLELAWRDLMDPHANLTIYYFWAPERKTLDTRIQMFRDTEHVGIVWWKISDIVEAERWPVHG